MDDLSELLNTLAYIKDFNKICISLASPEKIRSWSYGEIKTSETLKYGTFQPENHGLFCAKTFGPINNYECLCGKYKMLTYQGIVCEKCGVEVTLAKVRRERMGHIELAVPIVHIWYFKSLPSRIGLLLDMSWRDLERILYFDAYVVIEPGLTDLKLKQILSENAYLEALKIYEHEFEARMGGEAIYELLSALDLVVLKNNLCEQIKDTHAKIHQKKLKKRLKLVEALLQSHTKPQWMVLTVLPVLPPDLRPLVPLENIERFASIDLNNLYRCVINRNNRTKRLLKLKVPELIIRNELRLLQKAVDALLDNAKQPRAITRKNKRPLQSLSDMIKGKQGSFRQNLLNKRVDYSGRTVIIVKPNLKWYQCGLPKEMALELFKPFLFNLMRQRGLAASIRIAKSLIEQRKPEVWEMLKQVVHEHPILLNRIPTLSRLSIQAFEPILIEGKAIQLHPLVAQAFKARFDGEQMTVHIPLTIEAQLESRVLMMSNHNILSPVNGEPSNVPSQEMILGLYNMTYQRPGAKGEGMVFADINEVQRAYENEAVDLQASIQLSVINYQLSVNSYLKQNHPEQTSNSTEAHRKRVKTTVGRAILSQCLPKFLPFDLINRPLTKKNLFNLIKTVFQYLNLNESNHFVDKLMQVGLTYATRAAISLNLDDFIIAEQKPKLIEEAKTQIDDIQQKYQKNQITQNQRYYQIIHTWAKTTDKITHAALNTLYQAVQPTLSSKTQKESKALKNKRNALSIMIEAGVQSAKEIVQLTGMRGLIIKPNGSILETPILANYREGLDIHQYFLSTHSARKKIIDTTIEIANASYLTRRLIEVAQDIIITETDCGTQQGITLTAITKKGQIIKPLSERILGRVVAEDMFQPGKWFIKAGTLLDEKGIIFLENKKIKKVKVRSPVTCQSQYGICAMCYGRDLANRKKVNIGEAVGVIAAQAIGESCIQLIKQTPDAQDIAKKVAAISHLEATSQNGLEFHHDKLNTLNITSSLPRLANLFEVSIPKGTAILAYRSGIARFIQSTQTKHRFSIIDKNGQYDEFSISKRRNIKISDGQEVQLGDVIVEGETNPHDILYLKGINELANYFINEIQEIYEYHNITINDKHLEIIIRQMTCTMTIINPGNTTFLKGDIVTRAKLIEENQIISKRMSLKNHIATWKPNLLGITKASLSIKSFLSAASFMDTKRILLNSAINNQCDKLHGIKENVITGRLIPAGTGFKNISTTDRE